MTAMTTAECCRTAESCLPDSEYRTWLTALHDEMLAEIEAKDALLRQALEALEDIARQPEGDEQSAQAVAKEAITAISARLEGKG